MNTFIILAKILSAFAINIVFPGVVIYLLVFKKQLKGNFVWGFGLSVIIGMVTEIVLGSLSILIFGKQYFRMVPLLFLSVLLLYGVHYFRKNKSNPKNYFEKIRQPLIIFSVILSMWIIGYAIGYTSSENDSPKQYPTEFYILGGNHKLLQNPVANKNSMIYLGVTSRESVPTIFYIDVYSETTLIDKIGPIQLDPDQNWELPYQIYGVVNQGSQNKIYFRLINNDNVYRELLINLSSD